MHVRAVQNTVTLLLCKIQDLQDSTTDCPNWIQDPQDPAESFLSEIQDPEDSTEMLSWQYPRSLRSREKVKI